MNWPALFAANFTTTLYKLVIWGATKQLRDIIEMRFTILVFLTLFVSSLFSTTNNAAAASRTYLVNGIASAIPFIGYGMRNLKKKIPGAKLFSYISSGEGSAVARNIVKDAVARHAADPAISINLIGISYGANMVTIIAGKLAAKGVPVNYLGIIDGTALTSIKSNVRKADNFICTNSGCTGAKASFAPGNSTTQFNKYTIKSAHIALGDHAQVHNRVIAQIR